MKKNSFVTILLMVLMSMCGTKAFSGEIYTDGDTFYISDDRDDRIYVGYTVKNDTEVCFSYCYSAWDDPGPNSFNIVDIPEYVQHNCKQYKVTSISSGALSSHETLFSVTIPSTVTSIANNTFSGCRDLHVIKVNSENKKYDSRDNCNALIETSTNALIGGCNGTVIPNSVTSIMGGAFSGLRYLTSITIPSSVTFIGDGAFNSCSALTTVYCLNSVPPSCDNSFNVDKDKCVLWVPKGSVEAYRNANGWKEFKNIAAFSSTPDDGEKISGKCGDKVYYVYNEKTHALTISGEGQMEVYAPSDVEYAPWYWYAGDIHSLVIESGVTSIGNWAFSECSNMTSVTIANSVTYIGRWAFYDCSSLTSVTIPNSVEKIDWLAFCGCSSISSLIIGNSLTDISGDAFDVYTNLTSIIVAEGNPKYDSRNNCNALIETSTNTLIMGCKNTIIPNSVTSIGGGAFGGCTGLTFVTIPNSVTSIGAYAFSGCSGLTSVTIPNSVTSIGGYAFKGCTGLTSVTIPNSLTSIGDGVFCSCTGLTSVIIPNSVTSIWSDAFKDCTGLTSITIPNSVKSIGCGAFDGTAWFDNQPDGLVYAGKVAYKYKGEMPANTQITLKEGTKGIADSAFENCKGMTSVTIPNSVASIGYSAFRGCSGMSSVIIPNSVTTICDEAFMGCSGLSSVIIPNSVTTIGDYAFDALGSVTIGKNVQSIGKSAFGMHLEGPTNVISRIENPFPILGEYLGDYNSEFTWSTFRNGVLYVPAGTKEKYKETQGWNEFQNIKEYIDGDVNLDKKIDWNDVKALVDYIMGNAVDNFYEGFADLNGDGHIDAADVVKLVDMVNRISSGVF